MSLLSPGGSLAAGRVVAWGDTRLGAIDVPGGLTNVVGIAAGGYHSLALNANGTVTAWGDNDFGQTNVPSGLSNVVALSAGLYHTLALQAGGSVVAWGANSGVWPDEGQSSVPPGLSNVIAVAAGGMHSLALKSDGTVVGWGGNDYGQINIPVGLSNVVFIAGAMDSSLAIKGDGTFVGWAGSFPELMRPPPGLSNWVQVAGGNVHTIGLTTDGKVAAWGPTDTQGQLDVPPGLSNAVAIAAGGYNGVALKNDGTVVAWGDNWAGESTVPAGLSNAVAVAAGFYHCLALVNDGSPVITWQPRDQSVFSGWPVALRVGVASTAPLSYQWRFNGSGFASTTDAVLIIPAADPTNAGSYSVVVSNAFGSILSSNCTLTLLTPPPIILAQPTNQVAYEGGTATFQISATGPLPMGYQWAFGGVDLTGATNNTLNLANVSAADAGRYSVRISNAYGATTSTNVTLFVLNVACWGDNRFGQTNPRPDLTNVVQIAAGDDFGLALMTNGLVAAWGRNNYGQTNLPPGLTNIQAISAGSTHCLALTSDGTVRAWGNNANGQTSVPLGLTNVAAIAAGGMHSMALTADGTVVTWGTPSGGYSAGTIPMPGALTNIIAIAAGWGHCLALTEDGILRAWGFNYWSQSSVPSTLSNVVAIAAGWGHSVALTADGPVTAWGSYMSGESSVPLDLTNAVDIATGSKSQFSLALRKDTTVSAWGMYDTGSLVPMTVLPGLTNTVAISGGLTFGAALAGAGAPIVTSPRVSRTGAYGLTSYLRATVVGKLPMAFQWQFNGTNVPGATNAVLCLGNLQAQHAGVYSLVASNSLGMVKGPDIPFDVAPFRIVAQPQSQTVGASYGAAFTVSTFGTGPFTYQWLKDGTPLAGATNSSYSLLSAQCSDAGNYSVVVSNAAGTVQSANAFLTVLGPYSFDTLAGAASVLGTNDGLRGEARFDHPAGIAVDAEGSLYVSDYYQHTIRRISPFGLVTTVAGSPGLAGTNDGTGAAARFDHPEGLALDSSNNLYIADSYNHTIRKMSSDGVVTTLAGQPRVSGSLNGTGAAARFSTPNAVAVDANGTLYVTESGNRDVRKITPSGVVCLVKNWLNGPAGVAVDAAGTFLLIADGNAIRRIILPTNGVSDVVAVGSPYGGTMDAAGNFYFAGLSDDTVRVVTPAGNLYTLAGAHNIAGSADGLGSIARFHSYQSGAAIDPAGNLYVADCLNATVRKGVPFAVSTLPQSQGVPAGSNIVLETGAAGNGVFSYQWSFAGAPLPGHTNATLALGPLGRADSGLYTVAISNGVANWILFDARIRVLMPPVIQAPRITTNGTAQLFFQDSDGGLPDDPALITVQWRTNLPTASDPKWQALISGVYLTNGFCSVVDTNASKWPRVFYRVLAK